MSDRYSNPNAAQVRLAAASAAKTGGQRKHDLRIGKQPGYVDESRSALNRILIQPKTAAEMRSRAGERRARLPRKRAMKSNAAVSFSGIITFGHLAHLRFERLTPDQQDAAFLDLARAVADRHKADLTGLVVHVDEAGLHAHFQMDAYDEDGNALSDQIDRKALREVQDLTAEIMGRHCSGIERGRGKVERLRAGAEPAEVVYKLPAEMRRKLARDIEQAEKARADLEAERGTLAARVEKLKAYGDELTEKGAKQLETAQRRLEAREAAIREASETLERLQNAARDAQRASERAQEAESRERASLARLEPLRAAVEALDAHQRAAEAATAAEIQPEDAAAALEWLTEPLRTISDPTAAHAAFAGRHEAGLLAPRNPADAASFSLDTQQGTKPEGDATLGTVLKVLARRLDVWGLNVFDAGGKIPKQVRTRLQHEKFGEIFQSPDARRRQEILHLATVALRKIDEALTGIAAVIRGSRLAAPKPPPPEARPLLDLPEATRATIIDAMKGRSEQPQPDPPKPRRLDSPPR